MKCCPADKNIKKEWTESLEIESSKVSRDKLAEICNLSKVFSHPLRVKIALLLNKRDLCVCEMVSILKERQNLISHHLAIMKKNRTISSYNQSKYKYYMIEGAASDFLSALSDKMMLRR